MKRYLVTAALLTAGLVAGCGSNGGTTQTTAVTGKVADGYMVNATVFMDKNSNYQLDPGEPSTTTDANGAYTLNVDPADTGKYPIVAMAIQGVTVDKDTMTANTPNGTPVASTYVMSLPAGSVSGTVSSNFISPISSELREMMETGQYSSASAAMAALRTKLGLPAGTDVMQDYMAANHVGMHTAAQNIAKIMQGQMAQVMGGSGNPGTVQVNRYRGMMGSIFSNLSSVRAANPQVGNTQLMTQITAALSNMPMGSTGQPYINMSTAFRGGMMGGRNTGGTGGMAGGM